MKSIKKKDFLRKLTKVGSDIKKVQQLTSILKKAGFLTGFATFAGGIATGGVGIAILTVGLAGLALTKLIKKKGKHHDLTTEQKELLTSLLEKFMKNHGNDSTEDCEKIDDKLTDKEKEQIETILNLLKHDKDDSSTHSNDDVKDDFKDKENKKNDDNNKQDDDKELLDVILTLLKNKEKQKN